MSLAHWKPSCSPNSKRRQAQPARPRVRRSLVELIQSAMNLLQFLIMLSVHVAAAIAVPVCLYVALQLIFLVARRVLAAL